MSQATQFVLDNLSAQIAATRVDIDSALISGNATATLRKRLSTLESDHAAAQSRHESAHADAHAQAVSAAEDAAATMARTASANVNRALAAIGSELRLADDDHRFLDGARSVMHRQLAVDEVESKYEAAYAKFVRVHEQLSKVTQKHDELVAARHAGDVSDKTASQLYATAQDKQQLESIAGSAPARANASNERAFLANAKADFAKQQSDAILDLASGDIARLENAYIERVRGLDHYARSNRLINGGSVFSVLKLGERLSYLLRTGSIPA